MIKQISDFCLGLSGTFSTVSQTLVAACLGTVKTTSSIDISIWHLSQAFGLQNACNHRYQGKVSKYAAIKLFLPPSYIDCNYIHAIASLATQTIKQICHWHALKWRTLTVSHTIDGYSQVGLCMCVCSPIVPVDLETCFNLKETPKDLGTIKLRTWCPNQLTFHNLCPKLGLSLHMGMKQIRLRITELVISKLNL